MQVTSFPIHRVEENDRSMYRLYLKDLSLGKTGILDLEVGLWISSRGNTMDDVEASGEFKKYETWLTEPYLLGHLSSLGHVIDETPTNRLIVGLERTGNSYLDEDWNNSLVVHATVDKPPESGEEDTDVEDAWMVEPRTNFIRWVSPVVNIRPTLEKVCDRLVERLETNLSPGDLVHEAGSRQIYKVVKVGDINREKLRRDILCTPMNLVSGKALSGGNKKLNAVDCALVTEEVITQIIREEEERITKLRSVWMPKAVKVR